MNAPSLQLDKEYSRCAYLRQTDIDRLLSAGVPPLAIAYDSDGDGLCLARDRVCFLDNGRFEFERYCRDASDVTSAVVIPCRNEFGDLADLVAWRGNSLSTWLGFVPMIGAHSIYDVRLLEALPVHAGPLDWLQAGRDGVVIIDPIGAAPLLRLVEPLAVASVAHGRRLREALTMKPPRIVVASNDARCAA